MQIQVHTDNHTSGSAQRTLDVQALVEDKLRHFKERITRVDVHLTDENSAAKKRDNDKRCQMEVRLNGHQPLSVTDHGSTHEQALRGAAGKMYGLIESTLGKLDAR
jgi:hypothetical protein